MDYPRDELIPIRSMVNELPRQQDQRPIHPSTITRWALYGLGGVILPTIKLAGRRYVRRDDLQRFLTQCASQKAPRPEATISISASVERAHHQR
jgi:hypothetical protein